MGCFDLSCCVSGLPIRADDPVMFFLVTKNPSARRCTHSVDGTWVARTFPLRARYNDYGSIEEVEEGPLRDVILEGLAQDVVEKGVGSNVCHDVAVRRDMDFDALLRALWEGRVEVRAGFGRGTRKEPTHEDKIAWDAEAGPGVPTIRRIEEAITKAGLPVAFNVDGNWNLPNGYIVDRLNPGEVTIRYFGGFGLGQEGTAQHLEKVLPLLTEYATALWPHDYNEAEIRVRPKVGTTFHQIHHYWDNTLSVKQAMIRQDVWDAILQLRVPKSWYASDGKTVGIREYVRDARRTWADLSRPAGMDEVLARVTEGGEKFRERYGAPVLTYVGGESQGAGGSVTLYGHADLLMRKKLSRAQVRYITQRAGEFAFVRAVLGRAGRYHLPSHHSPGQSTPPHPALALQEAIIKVTRRNRRKYDRMR